MGKPWARYEQNYINHPKFLALTANAICLWLEGKNYCDMHQTDGLIPKEALKTFRFDGTKSLALLLQSCGHKPNLEPYAALWEPHVIGYHMHDYLDHNDCRDAVLARIALADEAKDRHRANQRAYRDRTKAERDQCVTGHSAVTRPSPESHGSVTVTDKQQQQQKQQQNQNQKKQEQERETVLRAHSNTVFEGSLPRDHRAHAFCSDTFAVCVPSQLHGKFLAAIQQPKFKGDRELAHKALIEWYREVTTALPEDFIVGDVFKFWQPQFDAKWATAPLATTQTLDPYKAVTGPMVRR